MVIVWQAPSSAADFEREVMASPNSSLLWIKYMAFLISLGDIEQARAVAQRAFSAINYRWAGGPARSPGCGLGPMEPELLDACPASLQLPP